MKNFSKYPRCEQTQNVFLTTQTPILKHSHTRTHTRLLTSLHIHENKHTNGRTNEHTLINQPTIRNYPLNRITE